MLLLAFQPNMVRGNKLGALLTYTVVLKWIDMVRQHDIVKILLALTVAFILDEEPEDARGRK